MLVIQKWENTENEKMQEEVWWEVGERTGRINNQPEPRKNETVIRKPVSLYADLK